MSPCHWLCVFFFTKNNIFFKNIFFLKKPKANDKVTRVTLSLVLGIFLQKIKYILKNILFYKKILRAKDKVTRVHT